MAAIWNFAWSLFQVFQNPFRSIQHPKNLMLDTLIIQIDQLVQKI